MRWMGLCVVALVGGSGCARSALDVNRSLWSGYLDTQAVCRDGSEDPGIALMARDVLGEPLPVAGWVQEGGAFVLPPDPRCPDAEILAASRKGDESAKRAMAGYRRASLRRHVWGPYTVVRKECGAPVEYPPLVPARLARTRFMRKYALSLVANQENAETQVEVTSSDVEGFARAALGIATNREEAEQTGVGRVLQLYLGAWLKGKFIDRTGTQHPAPSIIQEGGDGKPPAILIENDDLTAFASIALAAIADAVLQTPVLVKGTSEMPIYFTEKVPTFATLFRRLEFVTECTIGAPIEQCGRPGITELEASIIRKVSTLAAARSKALSGLVVGLFKETKIEFVLGVHFAVGDADSLRLLVETMFSVASRRLTEHLVYKALAEFEYTRNLATGEIRPYGNDENPLGWVIALMLQEHGILEDLLEDLPD